MPGAPNNRRSQRWWPPLLAGLTAFVVAALGGATNVATSLLPTKWAWAHDAVIMWGLAGGLVVLTVGLAVIGGRDDRGLTGGADDRQLHGVVTGSAGDPPGGSRQILAGEIPHRPAAFVERQAGADLAGAWDAGARVCVVQAITGGAGVGKTQAAAAYARDRAAAGWPLVAWVTARPRTSCWPASAASRSWWVLPTTTATRRFPPGTCGATWRLAPVRHWWCSTMRPTLMACPRSCPPGAVQTVITSRDRAFTGLGVTIDVGLFTPAQSVAYLTDRTGLTDKDGATAVSADLGHLPLALAQVATLISDHSWDYATFRQRMRTAPAAQYLTRHAGDPYPRGAVEAIALAIASAGDQDDSGLTRMIIGLLAVLSAEGVSRSVLAGLADVRPLPRQCRSLWDGMKPSTASWGGWWAGRSSPALEPGRRSACTAWSAGSSGNAKRRTGGCCGPLVSLPTCCRRFRFPTRKDG